MSGVGNEPDPDFLLCVSLLLGLLGFCDLAYAADSGDGGGAALLSRRFIPLFGFTLPTRNTSPYWSSRHKLNRSPSIFAACGAREDLSPKTRTSQYLARRLFVKIQK